MSKRSKYHVTKTEEGWQGKLEGSTRASVTGTTKEEVLKKTIEIAKNKDSSSVIIHKEDGKIQEERTYPKKQIHFRQLVNIKPPSNSCIIVSCAIVI